MTTIFKSFQDLGYQFAGHIDAEVSYASYLVEHVPDLTAVPQDVIDQVKAGFILRYAELHPAKHYMQDGEDTFVECEPEDLKDTAGFECSVGYCVSLPRHEFGELKPNKKNLVKKIRDAAKMYADIRWSRLLKAAVGITQDAAGKVRAANKSFQEWLDKMLADAVTKARVAVKNGDPTAIDPAKLQVRIEQFKNNLKA